MSGSGHPQAPEPPRGEEGEPPEASAFPREALTRMIARSERDRQWREVLQVWLLGAGVVTLALGMPAERLWGEHELVRQVAGEGPPSYGLLVPIGSLIRHLFDLSPERACYLIAALAHGLCLPALWGMMRSIGFPHAVALGSAALGVVAPGAWYAASLPLDFSAGVLGATLLAWSLFATGERTRSGYEWRAACSMLLAIMLRPENLLLLPAACLAVADHSARKKQTRFPAFSLALVTLVSLYILMGSGELRVEREQHLLRTLLGGGDPNLPGLAGWLVWLPAYLGVTGIGLWLLLFGKRTAEESPPPRWVVPWCVVALVPVLGGSLSHGPVAGYLLPLAVIGVADGLNRLERPDQRLQLTLLAAAVQLLLTAMTLVFARTSDPEAQWRQVMRQELSPGDLVLVGDRRRAYFIEQRFGLEAGLLPARQDSEALEALASHARTVRHEGRRVVYDSWALRPATSPPEVEPELLDAISVELRARE